tara:strand:- start:134 stop:676 length:543 start_codon:yes stop_codon:yes gene_type:complete
MKVYIITENWQYSDKRVTRAVNDYANALSDKYELKVFHVTKIHSLKMRLFRRIFYLPLSLYNGMLPINIYEDSSFNTNDFSFTKIDRNNFNFKKINISLQDKIIIHWLDTALFILSNIELNLLKEYDITVIVHELHPSKWLSKQHNIKILNNVRVLSRNKKITSYLQDYGINSKVIRSFI